MATAKKEFTLGELIKSTAKELKDARAETAGDAVMVFEKCELELAVSISAEAKAGFKFYLIEAGGGVKGETVSKIKLSFGPVPGGAAPAYSATLASGKGEPRQK